MKVLLINPPFQRLKGLKSIYFPLGLGYLAAVLKERGYEVKIYNAEIGRKDEYTGVVDNLSLLKNHHKYIQSLTNNNHPVWAEVQGILKQYNPELIGLTVMTPHLGSAIKVSSLVKQWKQDCIVVWGGPHATLQAYEVLENELIDFVIRGEGEHSFSELVERMENGKDSFSEIGGLSYRMQGRIVHNPILSLEENLDRFPFPARKQVWNEKDYTPLSLAVMITSRGCPFHCGFCSTRALWGPKVRYRALDEVIAEIKEVARQFKAWEFFFWDDSFTAHRERVLDLCQRLKREKLDIMWRCNTRVDLLDAELLKIMHQAGCVNIDIGIESGSQAILEKIDKGLSMEQVIKGVNLLNASGINWQAFFMIGFPDETKDDIKQTIELIEKLNVTRIHFSIFTPYPGTTLNHRAKELALLPEKVDWSQFSHQSPENHFVKNISRAEFKQIALELAQVVDRINSKKRAWLRHLSARRKFFYRHPLRLISIIKDYLRKL